MDTKNVVLNIAVNLGRMARWASEGRRDRIVQFIDDTQGYLIQLEQMSRSDKFDKTFRLFRESFHSLVSDIRCDDVWAEEAHTWANILTHRAKLA
mgnify:FL=1